MKSFARELRLARRNVAKFRRSIPRSTAKDRVLLANSCTDGKASGELLALCYLAELEDNARGIFKLLKGVDPSVSVTLSSLLPAALRQLKQAAGFPDKSLSSAG